MKKLIGIVAVGALFIFTACGKTKYETKNFEFNPTKDDVKDLKDFYYYVTGKEDDDILEYIQNKRVKSVKAGSIYNFDLIYDFDEEEKVIKGVFKTRLDVKMSGELTYSTCLSTETEYQYNYTRCYVIANDDDGLYYRYDKEDGKTRIGHDPSRGNRLEIITITYRITFDKKFGSGKTPTLLKEEYITNTTSILCKNPEIVKF